MPRDIRDPLNRHRRHEVCEMRHSHLAPPDPMRLTMSKKLRRLGNQTRGKDGSARDGTADVAVNVIASPYKSPVLLSMLRNGTCPVTQ
ncbi:hypothetical protein COMA2_10351 [Candidatus Nitrospira nitrificans]|uniref:Uncharacterized protein n=1 Tax=Candidatus Nitrospira nitrificans TaxID=1742973 RepID=A0A0S4L310_9BACT|nr:hypothetical protein COMA2_10351 [Candidatus Nitrospira nitrificans]